MKPVTADYLSKARRTLAGAQRIAERAELPEIAAREAYLAAFSAAMAYIVELTGKISKTHSGTRSEFNRLARAEPRIPREIVRFLASGYEIKTVADYGVGEASVAISDEEAAAAITTAERFIACIAALLE
jgi:uncharacterized protein (UPF0332 family)